jgi:hypothetical protein
MKDLMPDKDEDITKLTKEQASEVIETRTPTGLFYTKENGLFIGIDNSSGDAWTEEFKTKESCFKWLRGGRARDKLVRDRMVQIHDSLQRGGEKR